MEPATSGEALSREQARQYFEFFTSVARAEVLLVGELLVYHVHKLNASKRRFLCAGESIFPPYRCKLCELANDSTAGVEPKIEAHFAPAFVRRRKGGPFSPRVAAFPQGAGRKLAGEIGYKPARGLRMFVEREGKRKAGRLVFDRFYRLPKGFPATLPPAFDPIPLIRPFYGLPATPPTMPPDLVIEKAPRPKAGSLGHQFTLPEINASWSLEDEA